jgi:hypothetical protein
MKIWASPRKIKKPRQSVAGRQENRAGDRRICVAFLDQYRHEKSEKSRDQQVSDHRHQHNREEEDVVVHDQNNEAGDRAVDGAVNQADHQFLPEVMPESLPVDVLL